MKTTYIQGETIKATVIATGASSIVMRWWPERSSSLKTAAEQLLSSLKQSVTVGEISTTDKTAEEIAALDGLIRGSSPSNGGSCDLAKTSDGSWTCSVDSSRFYGSYGYVILKTEADEVSAVESGKFTVEGDPAAADVGGGIFAIHTRFV